MLGAATEAKESKLELSAETQALFECAQAGDVQAQYTLGCHYYFGLGKGLSINEKEAFRWFQLAAAQNYALAVCRVGICYGYGIGVEKDIVKAVELCQQSIERVVTAAEKGDGDAQACLGTCYRNGWGVKEDAKQAVAWYRKAADQGDARGQFALGICYATGQGVEKDEKEAVVWYRKAADQGHADGQFNLGFYYATGQGVDQDAKQALTWYGKAADQGDADGQYALGVCYANGQGVEKDEKQAVAWYHQAADQGHAGGQYALGVCYANGQGVEKDEKQAVAWFCQAARQGHADGTYLVGLCYASEWGLEKEANNREQALRWFQKTTELEFTDNIRDLQWGAYLGAGNFGVVFEGIHLSSPDKPVAIKQLKMEHLTDAEVMKEFKTECDLIPRLQRMPNVVQYLSCTLTFPYWLVMEYFPNGSLHDRLHGKKGHHDKPPLSWDNRYRLMTDIVRGLTQLHAANILHADLRSENILLESAAEENKESAERKNVADEKLVAKLSDFGLARTKEEISRKASSKSSGNLGVSGWLAPELYQPGGVKFTQKTDIYSLGTTLWEIVSGREPIGNTSTQMCDPIRQHQREEIPKDCPPKIASLIRFCWKTEPAERPQAAHALKYLEESKEEDFEKFAASLKLS